MLPSGSITTLSPAALPSNSNTSLPGSSTLSSLPPSQGIDINNFRPDDGPSEEDEVEIDWDDGELEYGESLDDDDDGFYEDY